MKKMLYFMGVEWNWIFQRPHMFALKFEKEYDITVVCPKQLIHPKHQNNRPPKRLKELFQIPFQEKNKCIGVVAWKLHMNILGDLSQYDVIWVGYPLFGRYIPKDYQGIVVYDCMDNFEAIYSDRNERNLQRICKEERNLLMRADIVFASSLKLKEKLLSICPEKEIFIVRNGYSNITLITPEQSKKKERYMLGYIGTISEWFDNDVILSSLKYYSEIEYNLIGPVEKRMIKDEKVIYSGVVEHKDLSTYVEKMDCLLMPFKVNDITLYVDPVKLYEYIAWGKCIIVGWYPEVDRFKDFVYFYHNEQEYIELVGKLIKAGFPAKFTKKMQESFLEDNSWDVRFRKIKECLGL